MCTTNVFMKHYSPYVNKVRKSYFYCKAHCQSYLGVIWKGFSSGVCMPKINMSLLVKMRQKLTLMTESLTVWNLCYNTSYFESKLVNLYPEISNTTVTLVNFILSQFQYMYIHINFRKKQVQYELSKFDCRKYVALRYGSVLLTRLNFRYLRMMKIMHFWHIELVVREVKAA